jgi:hypothetical protein
MPSLLVFPISNPRSLSTPQVLTSMPRNCLDSSAIQGLGCTELRIYDFAFKVIAAFVQMASYVITPKSSIGIGLGVRSLL